MSLPESNWLRLGPWALALAAVPLLIAAKRALRRRVLFNSTILPDIPLLGTSAQRKHGTVVICGGSIAGLFAARVSSNHFDRVIVVEPEEWSLTQAAREGDGVTGTRRVVKDDISFETLVHERHRVWQYTSYHGFQTLLLYVLRGMFTGLDDRISQRIKIRSSVGVFWINGWALRMPFKKRTDGTFILPDRIISSRRTLESTLRSLVAEDCPKIEYVHGLVTAIHLSNDETSVTGVSVRRANNPASATDFTCDMVIDCTGNAQAGLKLLGRALSPTKAAKIQTIRDEYTTNLRYTTLEFPAPPNLDANLAKITVEYPFQCDSHPTRYPASMNHWWIVWGATPDVSTMGLFAGRDDKGNVVVGAGGWESPMPHNYDELLSFMRQAGSDRPLPEWFFKIIALLEPVKDQSTCVENKPNDTFSRVWYERAADIVPRNFVALGDATLRLNPRNGEGVTKSAMGATTLDGILRRTREGPRDPNFSKTYFKLLAARTGHLWNSSRFIDYGAPGTKPVPGEKLSDGAFVRWFMSRISRVAERDDATSEVLLKSINFIGPGSDVLSPRILFKVFWEAAFPTKP